jgi:hypothetical protein
MKIVLRTPNGFESILAIERMTEIFLSWNSNNIFTGISHEKRLTYVLQVLVQGTCLLEYVSQMTKIDAPFCHYFVHTVIMV